MCENCKNKDVCKYKSQTENIENYAKNMNKNSIVISIKCHLKRSE